ncbi:MAG: flagellar motor switch protein FliG [Alphaproteobacteria bacterium]
MAGAASKRAELRGIDGRAKAAMIMLALSEEQASSVFGMMTDEEIKELSQAMAALGSVPSNVVEACFLEFAEEISQTGSVVGTFESTERLLMKVLDPSRVKNIMEEIRGPAGRTMWDKLSNVNDEVLAAYLKNEYPQTVAVVLSKIRPENAAGVLAALPEEFAMEVVMRLLRMETVQKEIIDDIEMTLRTEFMSNLARTNRRDSHEVIAEIFNSLDRNAEGRFITSLEERDRDAAEKVKSLMFTFDDLAKLDPSGVQTLLRKIEKDKLALALKGASEVIRDLFFTNMSERAGKLLREEMQSMGPVRLSDVDEAQAYIVSVAKELAGSGEIMLIDAKDDDELIY